MIAAEEASYLKDHHIVFGVENESGLGDVLAGSEEFGDVVLTNVARHLDLLPAGDATGQAAELIEGKHFQSFFEGLKAQYECVVFDSSPVLETSETRVLANLSDATLFVLRLDVSSKPNAIRARDILQGAEAKILGVQLNGARSKKGARTYAGGIAYGYGYGYGQRDRVA